MTPTQLRDLISAQYDLSHALYVEIERVRVAHGDGFTDDPHYRLLSAAINSVATTIDTLSVLESAYAPAEAAV